MSDRFVKFFGLAAAALGVAELTAVARGGLIAFLFNAELGFWLDPNWASIGYFGAMAIGGLLLAHLGWCLFREGASAVPGHRVRLVLAGALIALAIPAAAMASDMLGKTLSFGPAIDLVATVAGLVAGAWVMLTAEAFRK